MPGAAVCLLRSGEATMGIAMPWFGRGKHRGDSTASGNTDRRQLLLSAAAWSGALAGIATSGPARAFETYKASPQSGLGLAYSTRCGPASEHAGLMAQLRTQLASDPTATSMTASCPICGCPVTVSR